MFKYKWLLLLGIIFIIGQNIFKIEMPGVLRDSINELVHVHEEGNVEFEDGAILKLALISAGLFLASSCSMSCLMLLTFTILRS